MSLQDAIAAVQADQPREMTLADFPHSLNGLAELASQREQQGDVTAA